MPIGCRSPVDGLPEVQGLDHGLGSAAENFADGPADGLIGDLAGAEGVDGDRDRLGDADGVGKLDLAAAGEAGGHDVLGDVAAHVGGASVDLAGVLAGEGAAAVVAAAAVGVDDDLAAREAGVTHGATHHEAPSGVHMVDGVLVQQVGRQ